MNNFDWVYYYSLGCILWMTANTLTAVAVRDEEWPKLAISLAIVAPPFLRTLGII